MRKLFNLMFLTVAVLWISSCGGDDEASTVNYLIMEMKLVNVFRQDTITYSFSYTDGQLRQAEISGSQVNKSYTAQFDGNGKVIDAGNKRFEWDGDRLVKIIDDNGIWTDLTYSGGNLFSAELKRYNQNNQIESVGSLNMTTGGSNLSGIDNLNPSDQVIAKHSFSGFDSRMNLFKAIWWFHYVGETLGSFRSGALPDALFMANNPGSYKYELPQQSFERTINYAYTYDGQGRVILIEYTLGVDDYELIISY